MKEYYFRDVFNQTTQKQNSLITIVMIAIVILNVNDIVKKIL